MLQIWNYAPMHLLSTSSSHGHLSPYLHSGPWVLTSGTLKLKCGDESVKMKVRGWKCKDESARMKVWGWKCKDENAEDEKSEDEKARGWKTKDESEKMNYPRMKCHAAPIHILIHPCMCSCTDGFLCMYMNKTVWYVLLCIYQYHKICFFDSWKGKKFNLSLHPKEVDFEGSFRHSKEKSGSTNI